MQKILPRLIAVTSGERGYNMKGKFETLAVVSNDLISDLLNQAEIVVRKDLAIASFNDILSGFYENGKFVYEDCSLIAINSQEDNLRRAESEDDNKEWIDYICGNYIVNDEPVGGAFDIEDDNLVLVTKEFVNNALKMQENMKYLAEHFKGDGSGFKESMSEEVIRLRQQLQEAEAKLNAEPDMKALGRVLNAKSAQVRGEKRIKSQAVILSCAIRGRSSNEIADILAERGFGNSSAAISRALSVLNPEDKDRLRGIMSACPDEFEGLTGDDFEKWFSRKHEKALRSYKKKLINKRVKAEVEKEFSQGLVEMPAGN